MYQQKPLIHQGLQQPYYPFAICILSVSRKIWNPQIPVAACRVFFVRQYTCYVLLKLDLPCKESKKQKRAYSRNPHLRLMLLKIVIYRNEKTLHQLFATHNNIILFPRFLNFSLHLPRKFQCKISYPICHDSCYHRECNTTVYILFDI